MCLFKVVKMTTITFPLILYQPERSLNKRNQD